MQPNFSQVRTFLVPDCDPITLILNNNVLFLLRTSNIRICFITSANRTQTRSSSHTLGTFLTFLTPNPFTCPFFLDSIPRMRHNSTIRQIVAVTGSLQLKLVYCPQSNWMLKLVKLTVLQEVPAGQIFSVSLSITCHDPPGPVGAADAPQWPVKEGN